MQAQKRYSDQYVSDFSLWSLFAWYFFTQTLFMSLLSRVTYCISKPCFVYVLWFYCVFCVISFLTGYSSASYSKMAIPEWIYIPHMAPHGSSQQHQCRQRQALPVLVGINTILWPAILNLWHFFGIWVFLCVWTYCIYNAKIERKLCSAHLWCNKTKRGGIHRSWC